MALFCYKQHANPFTPLPPKVTNWLTKCVCVCVFLCVCAKHQITSQLASRTARFPLGWVGVTVVTRGVPSSKQREMHGGGDLDLAFIGLFNLICGKLSGDLNDWWLDLRSRCSGGEKRWREQSRHRGGFKLDIWCYYYLFPCVAVV